MHSLLALLIPGKTLDKRKGPPVGGGTDGEQRITQPGVINNAPKVLLLVSLANRKLVVTDIAAFKRILIAIHPDLKLFEFVFEASLQAAHYFGLFSV